VRQALAAGPLPETLLPQVVALLAWDPVARETIEALRRAGPAALQPLVDPLLDPDTDFTIRRRLPLVLGTIADPRSVQGLLLALTDRRFEVRYRAGRALAHLLTLDSALRVLPDTAFGIVRREVETSTAVWEGRSLLDRMDDEAWSPVMDELVRDRANRSLEHVFTLLALVLPRKPLRIAFRGLHTDDPLLRGTALEYLETTLPPEIRKPLWPFLEPDRARRAATARPPGEALNDLLRMNDSIAIKLEDLRKKE
jgi:HEAT repeat protein